LLQGFNLTDRLGTVGSVGVGALMGGIAAELSGGDFGVGAISGAWVTLFNHMMHGKKNLLQKLMERLKDPNKPVVPGIYKTSAENIGYQLRQLDRSLDGWSNGGKVPDVIKFIADLNPIV
jgi:hypothetical protein